MKMDANLKMVLARNRILGEFKMQRASNETHRFIKGGGSQRAGGKGQSILSQSFCKVDAHMDQSLINPKSAWKTQETVASWAKPLPNLQPWKHLHLLQ